MVKQQSLAADLESLLGSDAVLPCERSVAFAVDGQVPQAVVTPGTVEQVAQVMRYAHGDGLAVIPWGGGSHMHIGNVPRRYDIALSLSRLDKVGEHEPADLTVTCQAGIPLAALRWHLAQHDQFVPLGPPWGEEATIGGVLAANASSASRHAYGGPRDFTIGLRVVTADGRITRAGGRVVKNVAGYDLCKLYIGSLGTLAVIVEATFKLWPLPKAERTAVAAFETPAQACSFAAELHRRGFSLRAFQLLNPTATAAARLAPEGLCALVIDLAGNAQAVERSYREIAGLARELLADFAEIDPATAWESRPRLVSPSEPILTCRASALPTKLPALMEALEAIDGALHILAWPTLGVVYASWPALADDEGTVRRLWAVASELDGTLVVEHCHPEMKRRIDVFGDSPPSFGLMRSVKQQFDPQGVLSPGRFVGRL